jgi:sugar phosphate isomerase/epimerase
MSISTLPLSYCTNVHPGRSVAEVETGLDRYTVQVAQRLGAPLAAGLWLAKPVVDELLAGPEDLPRFAERLAERGLTCHTLNAFPFGDFHSPSVKEKVYVPDWSDLRRLSYTEQCAIVLAELLPEGVDGSISTVPIGFKNLPHAVGMVDASIAKLIDAAKYLARMEHQTGKTIRLAIEPEPLCIIETTAEALSFFERLRDAAARHRASAEVDRHLGLCYDVCHQAVEFEDVAQSIRAIDAAGIRINKVHASCALEIVRPRQNVEAREALRRYVEPRYLHQVIGHSPDGKLARAVDLSDEVIDSPPEGLADAPAWRVHFHVPVDAEKMGPLGTTRQALKDALAAVAALDYAPHLEVETYTWDVLPGAGVDLVDGLTRELRATEGLLATLTK